MPGSALLKLDRLNSQHINLIGRVKIGATWANANQVFEDIVMPKIAFANRATVL